MATPPSTDHTAWVVWVSALSVTAVPSAFRVMVMGVAERSYSWPSETMRSARQVPTKGSPANPTGSAAGSAVVSS